MTTPKIAGVATADPRYRFDQRTVLSMAGYGDAQRAGFFANSQIEAGTSTSTPRPSSRARPPRDGGRAQRPLRSAARWSWPPRRCPGQWRARAGGRRTSTSSPPPPARAGSVPSLDAHLVRTLGLQTPGAAGARRRYRLRGRAGRAPAVLESPARLPRHRAVMVAVELCSAAYFLDDRLESAVAHAIFADGAGAVALSRRCRRPRSGHAPHAVPLRAPSRHGLPSTRADVPAWCSPGSAPYRRRHDEGDGRTS